MKLDFSAESLTSSLNRDFDSFSEFIEVLALWPVVSYRLAEDLLWETFQEEIKKLESQLVWTWYIISNDPKEKYFYLEYRNSQNTFWNPIKKKIWALKAMVQKLLWDFSDVLWAKQESFTEIDFRELKIWETKYRDHEFVEEVLSRIWDIFWTKFELREKNIEEYEWKRTPKKKEAIILPKGRKIMRTPQKVGLWWRRKTRRHPSLKAPKISPEKYWTSDILAHIESLLFENFWENINFLEFGYDIMVITAVISTLKIKHSNCDFISDKEWVFRIEWQVSENIWIQEEVSTDQEVRIPDWLEKISQPWARLKKLYEENVWIIMTVEFLVSIIWVERDKIMKANRNLNSKAFEWQSRKIHQLWVRTWRYVYCSEAELENINNKKERNIVCTSKVKWPDISGIELPQTIKVKNGEAMSYLSLFTQWTNNYTVYDYFFSHFWEGVSARDIWVWPDSGVYIKAVNKKLKEENTGQEIIRVARWIYKLTLLSIEENDTPNEDIKLSDLQWEKFRISQERASNIAKENKKWINLEK